MAHDTARSAQDWLRRPQSKLLAWWVPHAAIVAALAAPVPARTTVWIAALIWMGMACIMNAKRCGRTHCRYTGPYYLTMMVPVLVLGSSFASVGVYAWVALAGVILLGRKFIWWATERAWGKFS
jgi:hypothetical protein